MKKIEEINDINYFQNRLLKWYFDKGRHFSWRNKSVTNYEIIISEILLQRTRVDTVARFLPKFLKLYPSWRKLASATEYELQEIIKPLGIFKQRGTGLYLLAQKMHNNKGRFPKDYNKVKELPMMGEYVIKAYDLFVLKKKSPLFDVNMVRLLSRFFGENKNTVVSDRKYLEKLAYRIVDLEKCKELNWAILDYASLVCKSRKPDCLNCIIRSRCKYYRKK